MRTKQVSAGVVVFEFPMEVRVDLDLIIDGSAKTDEIVKEALKINRLELTKTIDVLVVERAASLAATR